MVFTRSSCVNNNTLFLPLHPHPLSSLLQTSFSSCRQALCTDPDIELKSFRTYQDTQNPGIFIIFFINPKLIMVVLSELLSEGSSFSSSIHGHSSPTCGHSSSTDGYIYDVFLSFRGVDTHHSFTDHLHKALIDANITTFLDDEEIETGEDLKPELESAIKASRASIIILSKNYASSTWCLDELVLILEERMTSNHIVIPIFYHVEPTHVRKQQSSFGDAMAKHKQTMEVETDANKRSQWAQKMDRWNKALIEVGNLKGCDVKGR
ncbi:unnamed protein product [Lactuca saligna]|uniref:TIR domain-containing protein n=1 Tax=Lactuca saligna TaxID=75948 RepID=A0AA35VY18_LACSI|nr:unnamed protein product [Lactuca saligna]